MDIEFKREASRVVRRISVVWFAQACAVSRVLDPAEVLRRMTGARV